MRNKKGEKEEIHKIQSIPSPRPSSTRRRDGTTSGKEGFRQGLEGGTSTGQYHPPSGDRSHYRQDGKWWKRNGRKEGRLPQSRFRAMDVTIACFADDMHALDESSCLLSFLLFLISFFFLSFIPPLSVGIRSSPVPVRLSRCCTREDKPTTEPPAWAQTREPWTLPPIVLSSRISAFCFLNRSLGPVTRRNMRRSVY